MLTSGIFEIKNPSIMIADIGVQYLMDDKGDKMAIIIPMERWVDIASKMAEYLEYQSLKKNLGTAFKDVARRNTQGTQQLAMTEFFD